MDVMILEVEEILVMEITWVLAALTILGFGLAAYFGLAWVKLKVELSDVDVKRVLADDFEHKHQLMKAEFESLSQRLLAERSKDLTDSHNESLAQVIKPLATELDGFKNVSTRFMSEKLVTESLYGRRFFRLNRLITKCQKMRLI